MPYCALLFLAICVSAFPLLIYLIKRPLAIGICFESDVSGLSIWTARTLCVTIITLVFVYVQNQLHDSSLVLLCHLKRVMPLNATGFILLSTTTRHKIVVCRLRQPIYKYKRFEDQDVVVAFDIPRELVVSRVPAERGDKRCCCAFGKYFAMQLLA